MNETKLQQVKTLELQKTANTEIAQVNETMPSAHYEESSKSLSDSLTQAQNQLGLCLQKQRQVGFILREVKDILKR